MAYTKQNFEDDQILEAEHLNKMEDAIAEAVEDIDNIVEEVGSDTLTWDGNTEGLEVFDSFYKVSDNVITIDMLSLGCSVTADGQTADVTEVITDDGEGIIFFDCGAFVYGELEGLSQGVYLMEGISSLTIPGYTGFTTEKIDPDYLPEHKHSWNELTDKPVVFVTVDEEMTLTLSLAEIYALWSAGTPVILLPTGAAITVKTGSEDVYTGAYSVKCEVNEIYANDNTGDTYRLEHFYTVYSFDENGKLNSAYMGNHLEALSKIM